MDKSFQSHWVPDSQVTHCKGCNSKFDTTNRKHHCRLCGDIFCDRCSARKIDLKEFSITGARACDSCFTYVNRYLPILTKETAFTRFEENSTSGVRVKLSSDRRMLSYRYESSKHFKGLDFDHFNKIEEGQKTAVWKKHQPGLFSCCTGGEDISKDAILCFSLCFVNESLDLCSESLPQKSEWLEAFRDFLSRRSTRGEKAWQNQISNEQMAFIVKEREEREQKSRNVTNKYSQLKDNMRTKYG
eukprot:TRINITY_DN12992_c0_g1_i1.p1 TRINITY_DN12992_c0_g1~~TRINITY_DN12992_c0_g1_i1.p1  ORF type:complete len:244 (-),score=27.64 TRINITY_DN12992_c0_g1_i1:51-782(-)